MRDEKKSRRAQVTRTDGNAYYAEDSSAGEGGAGKSGASASSGAHPVPHKHTEWLTLKEASELLGIHFTTLRAWADRGEISVFRTPGGHRRFSLADLRRFLEERAGKAIVSDSESFMNALVGRVREEMARSGSEHMAWRYALDDSTRDVRSRRGRELFALAISFVMKPQQRARILIDGRKLGEEYGREAAQSQVGLMDTGRAVQFFRSQLVNFLRSGGSAEGLDADDVRVQQLVDQFIDEVLYAVLSGYEGELSK
jgi:excisionase family DNA binding protein